MVLLGCFWANDSSYTQPLDSIVNSIINKAERIREEQGDALTAISILKDGLQGLEKDEVSPSLLLPIYHKLGVNYYYYGDNEQALFYTDKALRLREQSLGSKHLDVIRGYYLRAVLQKELQAYQEAKSDLGYAIVGMEELLDTKASTDTMRLLWMYEESIRLYAIVHDNQRALDYWDKAYRYYQADSTKYAWDIVHLYTTKGHILFNQQALQQAREVYRYALAFAEQQAVDDTEMLALLYSNLGLIEMRLSNYKAAGMQFQLAVQFIKTLLAENESPWLHQKLGTVYNNLVELHNLTANYKLAMGYANLAHQHYLLGYQTTFDVAFAVLYRDQAQVAIAQTDWPQALEYNRRSIAALVPTLNGMAPQSSPFSLQAHPVKDKIAFLETISQRTHILRELAELETAPVAMLQEAFEYTLMLDTVINQIHQSYTAAASRFDLVAKSHPVYETAIEVALTLYEQTQNPIYQTQAYHFAAKNKALILLQGMQEDRATVAATIPDELRRQEDEWRRTIFRLETALYQPLTDVERLPLQDSLFAAQRQYERLIKVFEASYPDYFQFKYATLNQPAINQLQSQLPTGSALVEYFVGDEHLYAFTITKTTFDYVRLNYPEHFEEDIRAFRWQVERQGSATQLMDAGQRIYQQVVAPAIAALSEDKSIEHLFIIPDDLLLLVPFEALPTNTDAEGPTYLLYDYATSYAYSNQLLFARDKQLEPTKAFAGFGLTYDPFTLQYLAADLQTDTDYEAATRQFGQLQYAVAELTAIRNQLGKGDLFLDEAATRDTFLRYAPLYQVLHLATHGLVDENYPLNSALVFTKSTANDNNYLRAADLYTLQLRADMAVLSACHTGAGRIQQGEGIRSLARAFSFAGCPSLVTSFWAASDKASKDILVEFYRQLSTGTSKSEALRQAKLTYLQQAPPVYQHPFYWANLNVIGDDSSILLAARTWWYKWAAGIAIMLMVIFIGLRLRKN